MLKLSDSPAQASDPKLSAMGRKPLLIEFEIDPPASDPQSGLDRVEAHLILLSMGGSAAARFDRALGAQLQAAGILKGQSQIHASVQQPQHLGPLLLASTKTRRLRDGLVVNTDVEEQEAHSAEETQAVVFATSAAALVATLTVLAAMTA